MPAQSVTVPRVRNLLERFRPAGAPGAATTAGVPADRRSEVSAELEPVFAEIAPTLLECERIRQEAAAVALHRREHAAERARVTVSRAQAEGEAERSAESARVRARAEAAESQALVDAETTATRLRGRARLRRPELVERAVRLVRAELGSPP